MKTSRSLLALTSALPLVCASVAIAADNTLFPFVLPGDDALPSITDLSGWLERPAGRRGRVRVGKDAHLYAGETRIRFLGVNLALAAGMPAKEDGAKIAARMAKFGITVVRFHHMDTSASPNGIRKRDANGTGQLDPEALDHLSYFIAYSKERGIYANINCSWAVRSTPRTVCRARDSDGLDEECVLEEDGLVRQYDTGRRKCPTKLRLYLMA